MAAAAVFQNLAVGGERRLNKEAEGEGPHVKSRVRLATTEGTELAESNGCRSTISGSFSFSCEKQKGKLDATDILKATNLSLLQGCKYLLNVNQRMSNILCKKKRTGF